MDLNLGYSIMKPLQLPWMFVSPSGFKGLDFHLAPDLFIRMEGIISGDLEFAIGEAVFQIEKIEVDQMAGEHLFMSEYFPGKSKERIARAFKSGESSCFFTSRQMEELQKLFNTRNFIAYDVSVYYQDRKVDDVASLPHHEFGLIAKAFENLDVRQNLSWKENKEILCEAYEENFKEKTAELEDKQKKSLWQKVKGKGLKKRIGIAFGVIFVGSGAIALQRWLAMSIGGPWGLLGAAVAGTIGMLLEVYGSSELGSIIKQLHFEGRTERMAF